MWGDLCHLRVGPSGSVRDVTESRGVVRIPLLNDSLV